MPHSPLTTRPTTRRLLAWRAALLGVLCSMAASMAWATRPAAVPHAADAFTMAAATARTSPASASPGATRACAALLDHRVLRLQDEQPQDLCQYTGRVTLVVNTASLCGFTGQYGELEALYQRYRDRGLVVLGFPSADFGRQEFESNERIADFCENTFGIRFPMFTKTTVRGPGTHPLFAQLAQRTGEVPGWNFHKYLIGRDGRTVLSYPTRVSPSQKDFVAAVERLLNMELN